VSQMLDDHIVMTQSMSFSPYKKPFEERITKWEAQLSLVSRPRPRKPQRLPTNLRRDHRAILETPSPTIAVMYGQCKAPIYIPRCPSIYPSILLLL
jgi:hypothetical protein